MRLNYPDYIKLVTEAYKKKRVDNELSLLLSQSTPAKIRQACLHMYKELYDKKEQQILRKDEQVLRDFFGPAEHGRQFLQLIREFETGKFKPLDNYLKGNTENTDDKNVELLAWLINFQHRPYSFDKNFQLTDEELSFVNNMGEKQTEPVTDKIDLQEKKATSETFPEKDKEEISVQVEEELEKPLSTISKNDKAKKRYKRAGIIFLILIICTGGIYAIWQQGKGNQIIMGNSNSGCMYWANDHYEKVPCNEEEKGRFFLPLNEKTMKIFKKITKEDTITEKSIGMIYYLKNEGKIEYFTAAGNHPVHLNRSLKVLSPHMFDTYLRKKENLNKDSLSEQ